MRSAIYDRPRGLSATASPFAWLAAPARLPDLLRRARKGHRRITAVFASKKKVTKC